MISQHTFHHTHAPAPFLRRWHRQHRWRMGHQGTRRMQNNSFRWYCLRLRVQHETLLTWARRERDTCTAYIERRITLPSTLDPANAAVHWHMANVYARVALGERLKDVAAEEEQSLLIRIRAYNAGQARIWDAKRDWRTGCAGYYGEEAAKMKIQHACQCVRLLNPSA